MLFDNSLSLPLSQTSYNSCVYIRFAFLMMVRERIGTE